MRRLTARFPIITEFIVDEAGPAAASSMAVAAKVVF